MRVIKFRLDLGHNLIDSPHLLDPQHLEFEDSQWTLWCCEYPLLKTNKPLELYLATTGEQVPDNMSYVATAANQTKTLVAHLFRYL